MLIDEVLTSDSSRFWFKPMYEPGKPQLSFEKQLLRNWLEASGWNKKPPAPELPEEIIAETEINYMMAFLVLCR